MKKTLSVRPVEDRTEPLKLQKKGRGWTIAESRLDTLHETAREMRRSPTAAGLQGLPPINPKKSRSVASPPVINDRRNVHRPRRVTAAMEISSHHNHRSRRGPADIHHAGRRHRVLHVNHFARRRCAHDDRRRRGDHDRPRLVHRRSDESARRGPDHRQVLDCRRLS